MDYYISVEAKKLETRIDKLEATMKRLIDNLEKTGCVKLSEVCPGSKPKNEIGPSEMVEGDAIIFDHIDIVVEYRAICTRCLKPLCDADGDAVILGAEQLLHRFRKSGWGYRLGGVYCKECKDFAPMEKIII